MNPVFADLPTTIFEVMSSLAREKRAINLGQGFPDGPGPEDVRRKAAEALMNGDNQYPSMMGLPELRAAIAAHYKRFQGVDIDPAMETMVTSGATEALAGAIFAAIEPGDEVVLFQPMYDAYLPLVRRAGGTPKFVTLKPPHWTFDEDDLDAAFSPRTKAVVFNNPLNPSGVVYARDQVELLARYCAKFGAIAICDEVWEHVIFDGRRHNGLGKDEAYFAGMRAMYQRSRDRFSAGLAECGFPVLPSEATYFVNVDLASIGETDDVAFCRRLVERHGVAAIPVSAFYAENHVRGVARFCFAKDDATLDAGLVRLRGAVRR